VLAVICEKVPVERRRIIIQGIVQGVGFRPFVFGLAVALHLHGLVRNQAGSVVIEAEGEAATLDRFLEQLECKPPPLARIDHLSWQPQTPRGDTGFCIETSTATADREIFFSPDVATCADCLAELNDPADRHYRYPFLNCTNCGPRLTIVRGAPYDRARTTMAAFPMCAACRTEYEDPANRRFHAQPTACLACGPQLQIMNAHGEPMAVAHPLASLAVALRTGQIAAMKGLGGYHLVCDARHEAAVGMLRRRKQRDEKPFALMVRDLMAAERICEIDAAERDLLQSWRRPIVLLRRRAEAGVAAAVAPGNPLLGVMLPYTPLHHLLLQELEEIALVMTSGNRSDEPIAYEDDDALQRLVGIADLFLMHNRRIHVRCDDSVTRVVDGKELPLRRSRGYAPEPIPLPFECSRQILAVGGQLKGTFALGRGRHGFLSHHLGDLDHYAAFQAFVKDIELYEELFSIEPEVIVHDLHPDYASTRYARERGAGKQQPLLAVQHHHAHLASCMADNGLDGEVIGVSFDGTGFGTDGAIWGGEFLVGGYRDFRRAAHLRYVGMPGGEQAIREPWRMAAAHLLDAGLDMGLLAQRIVPAQRQTIEKMLEKRFNTPWTSSAGRLFDAVAALAGVRDRVSYEGQAAVELEWLALTTEPDGDYPVAFGAGADGAFVVETQPLVRAVAADVGQEVAAARIARRFHSTMVALIVSVCERLRQETGLARVTLSGGVFLNALLTEEVVSRLHAEGFMAFRHRQVPPNDGGLSLGQLAIAAASSDKLKEAAAE
jgi:hydrogenase maturation protein HypF